MKSNILLFIFLFSVGFNVVCQSKESDYNSFPIKINDSIGKIVEVKPEYYRISAKDNLSWGFKNKAGDIIIPLGIYRFLNPIDSKGMILAQKGNKEGFIDIHQNILIPFIYDDVGVFSECVDLAPVIKSGKQGFVNREGEVVIPIVYDAKSYVTYFYAPGLAILKKNGKYGVINSENNNIIPFEYSEIKWSESNDYFIVTEGENWAIFSLEGVQLSDFDNYEIVRETPLGSIPKNSKNLPILIKKEGDKNLLAKIYNNPEYIRASQKTMDSLESSAGVQYAYINKEKKIIVPFGKYNHTEPFGLGRKAIVANEGFYGIIDEYGKLLLPLEYDLIERPANFSNYASIFLATHGQDVIIFDENLDLIPTKEIVSYENNRGELIALNKGGKYGRVNYNGKQTIPFEYDTLYHSRVKGYIANKNGWYGTITKKNEIIKPFEYKVIYALKDDIVFINQNDKAGIYDKNGNIKIPFEYDAIYDTYYNNFDLEKNRYIVVREGKVGTIDIHNNTIIPIIYDGLSGWVEYGPDAHFVKNNGKFGLISYNGKIIIPIEYDFIGIPHNDLIMVHQNGKYGVLTMKNKIILPCVYDKLIMDIPYWDFEEERAPKLIALKNRIWSYFDINGKLIHEDISEKEIMDNYKLFLDWGEPSNEYGLDMKTGKSLH